MPAVLTSTGELSRVLPAGCRTTVLRVVQEALSNVRKHADASEVTISLDLSRPDLLELSVHDNGCGFDPDELEEGTAGHHFGLGSMRGRVEELGGSLRLDGGIGCGTTVTVVLRLLPAKDAHRG